MTARAWDRRRYNSRVKRTMRMLERRPTPQLLSLREAFADFEQARKKFEANLPLANTLQYRDPLGRPITMALGNVLEAVPEIKRIAWTNTGEAVISTVYISLLSPYKGVPPYTHETMAFYEDDDRTWRWYSAKEAFEGHRAVVRAHRHGRPE